MRFTPSPRETVGVELELQILDARTLDLRSRVEPLLDALPPGVRAKRECFQSAVEVVTGVCPDLAAAEADLRASLTTLAAAAERQGLVLCAAGTHPFCLHLARVTDTPRYRSMEQRAGTLARRLTTFSLHVHCGMRSGEEAIVTMEGLRRLTPLFLALSANSPFWHGRDTGHAAWRHRLLAMDRSYGIPPRFGSWRSFVDHLDMARRAGIIEVIRDLHWDIRPRPDFGTVELRVMDAPSTLAEALALAALARSTMRWLQRGPAWPTELPGPLPWWLEKENHFRAARDGLAASLVWDDRGATRPVREVLDALIAAIRPIAEEVGEDGHIERCVTLAAETGAERQRRLVTEGLGLQDLVARLVDLLRDEVVAPA